MRDIQERKLYTYLSGDGTTSGLSSRFRSRLARVVTGELGSRARSRTSSQLPLGEHASLQRLRSTLLEVQRNTIVESLLGPEALSKLLHSEGLDGLRVTNELDTHFDEARYE